MFAEIQAQAAAQEGPFPVHQNPASSQEGPFPVHQNSVPIQEGPFQVHQHSVQEGPFTQNQNISPRSASQIFAEIQAAQTAQQERDPNNQIAVIFDQPNQQANTDP